MSEELQLPDKAGKKEIYEALLPQVRALIEHESDLIANMANVSAALYEAFGFLWVGFYLVRNDQLVLGPFQGPIACTRITFGKGVCGKSWEQKETLIVPDVNAFPGHIACSTKSRSEIVIPGIHERKVHFVLDIDSERADDFDRTDADYLEMMVSEIIIQSDL